MRGFAALCALGHCPLKSGHCGRVASRGSNVFCHAHVAAENEVDLPFAVRSARLVRGCLFEQRFCGMLLSSAFFTSAARMASASDLASARTFFSLFVLSCFSSELCPQVRTAQHSALVALLLCHLATFSWWPESSTSGTRRPCHSSGREYCGVLQKPRASGTLR